MITPYLGYKTMLFITVDFTDSEVESFKENRKEKDKLFTYNKYEKEFDTRWIGEACEVAFKSLLEKYNIPFVYHVKKTALDDRDFTIDDYEIDVKSYSTSYYPQSYYGCNISNNQWKVLDTSVVNLFVFSAFLLTTRSVLLLGVITKKRFQETAKFYAPGTIRGKMTIQWGNWEIPISELESIEEFLGI